MGKIFLLEVVVDNVEIDYEKTSIDRSLLDLAKQLCIKFQFLSFTELIICEEDFCTGENDYQKSNINMKSGKSCLFSIPKWDPQDKSLPLEVTVIRTNPAPPHLMIGKASINLGSSFTDILAAAGSPENAGTISKKCTDLYILTDDSGIDVGKIRIFVRLTCFGPLIVTQFQISGDENNTYLFRGTNGSGNLSFNPNISGHLHGSEGQNERGPGETQEKQLPERSGVQRPPDCPPCPPYPPGPADGRGGRQGAVPYDDHLMVGRSGAGTAPVGSQAGMHSVPPGGGTPIMHIGEPGLRPVGEQTIAPGVMPGTVPSGQLGVHPGGAPAMTQTNVPGMVPFGGPTAPVMAPGMTHFAGPGMMPAGEIGLVPGASPSMVHTGGPQVGTVGGFTATTGSRPGMIPNVGHVTALRGDPTVTSSGGPGMKLGGGFEMMPSGGSRLIHEVGQKIIPEMNDGVNDQYSSDYKIFGAEVNGQSICIKVLRKPRSKKKSKQPQMPFCGHIPIRKESTSSITEEEKGSIPQLGYHLCDCDYPHPAGFVPQQVSVPKGKKTKKHKVNKVKCPLDLSGHYCLKAECPMGYPMIPGLTQTKKGKNEADGKDGVSIKNVGFGFQELGSAGDHQGQKFVRINTEEMHQSGTPTFILNIPTKRFPLQSQTTTSSKNNRNESSTQYYEQ